MNFSGSRLLNFNILYNIKEKERSTKALKERDLKIEGNIDVQAIKISKELRKNENSKMVNKYLIEVALKSIFISHFSFQRREHTKIKTSNLSPNSFW